MEILQIISSIASAIGVVIAAIAAAQAVRLHKEQQHLNKVIHNQQLLLSRRQLLLPLWEHLRNLADINPSNIVWEDVRKSFNLLELVAVSWEGQLIDEDVMRRFFSMTYIEIYEKIERCINPPSNFPMDGPSMIRNSPATQRLYRLLVEELTEKGKLKPIT